MSQTHNLMTDRCGSNWLMFRIPAPRQSTDSAFLQMQSSGHTNSGAAVTSALDAGVASVASASALHSSNSVNKLVHIFVKISLAQPQISTFFSAAEKSFSRDAGRPVARPSLQTVQSTSLAYSWIHQWNIQINGQSVTSQPIYVLICRFFPFKFGTQKKMRHADGNAWNMQNTQRI